MIGVLRIISRSLQQAAGAVSSACGETLEFLVESSGGLLDYPKP